MGKIWNSFKGEYQEVSPQVVAFLNAYEALCREHKMALGHEDDQGAFYVHANALSETIEENIAWVKAAHLCDYGK